MKKLLSTLLCTALAVSMLTGCGSQAAAPAADTAETKETETAEEPTADNADTTAAAEEEGPVEVTLGIWPEDTLTDDIAMHEGFVEKM